GDDAADFNWTATPTMGAANTQPAANLGSSVVINEVDPNGGAPAFIELYNPTGSPVDLENWMIAVDDDYFIPAGQSIAAGGFWVLDEADFPQFFDLDASGDQVYLYDAAGVRVDQVGWNTAPGSSWNRLPDGAGPNDGWNDATSQLVAQTPTPNATNVLPVAPDWVINEILADPDPVNGDANGDGVVSSTQDEFVEIVNNSGAAMDISGWTLSDGNSVRHTFPADTIIPDECSVVVFGGGTPTGSFGNSVVQTASTGALGLNNDGDTVTLNDGSSNVVSYTYGPEGGDNQSLTRDPDITGPDPLIKHSTATGSGGALFSPGTQIDGSAFLGCLAACGGPSTPIHDIQGSGLVSPIVGQQVFAEALVNADYQDVSSIRGFFMEEPDGEQDADPATSEGIFIYDNNFGVDVAVGDTVRVAGTVAEYQEQTQLTSITSVTVCPSSPATASPVDVTLPFSETVYPERFEGMTVTMPQTMTVSENYNLGRGGILTLSNGRLQQPTNVVPPGAPANDLQAANNLNQITLDDGNLAQNPDPIIYPPPELTALNTVRSGDEVTNILGVMTQGTPGWSSAGILYRVYPYEMPTFTFANPRPAAPDPVRAGVSLRVSSFNVLNYFLTLAENGPICGPDQNEDCRGAWNASEFTRQRDKLLQALYILDADVLGLMELENTPGVEPLADLVDGLNALTAPGTYDYIDAGTFNPGDVIKVGIIYKPGVVQPVGDFAILNSLVDPNFNTNLNRPALAQTFDEVSNHGRFTVVVNHLKSKGCTNATGLDEDQGDGQGCYNFTRTQAANAELSWIATDPTNSGDPDFIIMGDLNAYAMEDPIDALETAGYTNLETAYQGPDAYSYVYFAQAGSLDHSMASPSMVSQVNGATTWHINADEPSVLDYNEEFKSANQLVILYNPDQYRTSDHDPLLIGLNLEPSEADLFVSKIANPDPVMLGETLYYTITTQNVSTPTVATDVVITDVLPGGVSFNGAAAYTGTCNESSGTVVCDMGDIGPDVIESVLISVTVDTAQCPGVLSNYVEVASNVYDPNPQNNSHTLETDVECAPPNIDVDPLSMASTQLPDTQVIQTLTISNTGASLLEWMIDEEPVAGPPEAVQPVTRIDSQATLQAELSGEDNTAPTIAGPRDLAAAARAQRMLGTTGLLLIPESSNDRVMAFDPTTGNL
ncbi:MAG: ExeM/NucH family extracellular endonuclease, partial [Anaerolineae bacterium]|nr:ExeM/NucH family extracellular endonuclease [Anaerolineae bacterium]